MPNPFPGWRPLSKSRFFHRQFREHSFLVVVALLGHDVPGRLGQLAAQSLGREDLAGLGRLPVVPAPAAPSYRRKGVKLESGHILLVERGGSQWGQRGAENEAAFPSALPASAPLRATAPKKPRPAPSTSDRRPCSSLVAKRCTPPALQALVQSSATKTRRRRLRARIFPPKYASPASRIFPGRTLPIPSRPLPRSGPIPSLRSLRSLREEFPVCLRQFMGRGAEPPGRDGSP